MIESFANKETAAIFAGKHVRAFPPHVQGKSLMKLRLLDAAKILDDLKAPPANRLEKLSGDRAGQWSIRVNDQYRICFTWRNGAAHSVELTDYH